MSVHLMVLKAPQASGKSTLSRWVEKNGYLRICTDEIAIAMYGKPSECGYNSKNPEHRKYTIDECKSQRDEAMLEGKDVVIDSGAGTFSDYLDLPHETQEKLRDMDVNVDKILLILHTTCEERIRRGVEGRRKYTQEQITERFTKSGAKFYEELPIMRQAVSAGEFTLLEYDNNTWADFYKIQARLQKLLGFSL